MHELYLHCKFRNTVKFPNANVFRCSAVCSYVISLKAVTRLIKQVNFYSDFKYAFRYLNVLAMSHEQADCSHSKQNFHPQKLLLKSMHVALSMTTVILKAGAVKLKW